jgi:hypothetical protein
VSQTPASANAELMRMCSGVVVQERTDEQVKVG